MVSDRMRRRLESFLDEADAAASASRWSEVAEKARAVLAIEGDNPDALAYLRMAEANLGSQATTESSRVPTAQPTAFASGRYEVRRLLGEGGKKRVFLAHDRSLDRDVAFALIKTEGLDDVGRERIVREAQAMGRLGAHPHVVTIFAVGNERGAPYVVTELLGGGDVEGLLENGPPPLARTLEIAKDVCHGLAFAHEQGVVHRDLKPGNVWLTTDGRAKLGDFGLAVALDRSRLTTHGLMVGTVTYMPPEQALGGDVTPQADLYSLGAMLYELVTGKPPFHADDPTAIISQHINTPPVAPSWHSEHCPPDLEALILRLLAKVPADRPSSASEVLEALERVDPDARSVSHSDSSANPLDRLARGVFVGRERELERLRAAFDEAVAGRGGVAMLVGEPGIGKTRTSMELQTYARMRGGRVIWGRAHEVAGAPPFRPWVQAGDSYAQQFGLDGIAARLEPGDAPELTRIFSGLRQQSNYLPPPEVADPDAAQFRLFEAVSHLLKAYAADAPLLVVLDDLHWADKPSLLLLRHIAHDLSRERILVLGNYRDTELSRTHPLSETLASLNREGGFLRINLGGLERDEVASYVRGVARTEPRREIVERVFEETEGNPFFLSQIVNLMAEEGALSKDSMSGVAIPEGVKEALGRRLDRLSEESNVLLQYAAIAGREFAYETLQAVSPHDDDTLLRLIEEGLRARVIEEGEVAGRYRFTHALMQETLLDELSTTRRVRMHGEVGDAIERRYGDRAEEQSARLAHHFGESATLNERHRAKAARYSEVGGDQAAAQFAWEEAARLYSQAVELATDGAEPSISLLHRLSTSAQSAADWRLAWRAFMGALELCRARGERIRFAEVALDAIRTPAPTERLREIRREALLGADQLDRLTVARLLVGVVFPEALDVQRARDLAADDPPPDLQGRFLSWDATVAAQGNDLVRADELAGRGVALLEAAGLASRALELHNRWAYFPMYRGDFDRYEAISLDFLAKATRLRNRQYVGFAHQNLAAVHFMQGEFGQFEEHAAQLPSNHFFTELYPAIRAAQEGRLAEAVALLPPPEKSGGARGFLGIVLAHRARVLASAGAPAEARAELDALADLIVWEPAAEAHDYYGVGDAYDLATDDFCRGAYAFLVARHGFRFNSYGMAGADRLRGVLALRLGLLDEAAEHFRVGLEWAEGQRCVVEAGRCHQGLAELAERRGDLEDARAHLDAAGTLFAQHGAKLYLDQVIVKKGILRA